MADTTTPQPGTEAGNEQDAKKVAQSSTSFGFSSVSLPTPKWANSAFDIYLIVVTSFLAWIVADTIFPKDITQHIVYLFTFLLTPIIKGISKMFGVKIDEKA